MPKDKNMGEIKQQLESNQIGQGAADKAKPRCSDCGKYTDKKTSPQCFGHGVGSSSTGGDSGEKAGNDSGIASSNVPGAIIDIAGLVSHVNASRGLSQQFQLNGKSFNPEIISDLLSNKLLMIDNNRESGILTIKLLCNPHLLSKEQRNQLHIYVDIILNELKQFKNQNRLSNKCESPHCDKEGNILSLRITLPTPTLYDAFIQRLANKSLLPTQNINQHVREKVVYPVGKNHFNSTLFSIKPTPFSNRNVKVIEDEEEHKTGKHSKKSSSIRS